MQLSLIEPTRRGGAEFSEPDRLYRWRLWRPTTGRGGRGQLTMCCLNPSDADEDDPDPTSTRQVVRAGLLGFDLLMMVNLFALVQTDRKLMKKAADPVGPGNDQRILSECRHAAMTICAWGNDGRHRGRAAEVVAMLRQAGVTLHVLRFTKQHEPEHPLYLPYELQPQLWSPSP